MFIKHSCVARLSPLSHQQCLCPQVILPCLVQLESLRPEKREKQMKGWDVANVVALLHQHHNVYCPTIFSLEQFHLAEQRTVNCLCDINCILIKVRMLFYMLLHAVMLPSKVPVAS